MKISLSICHSLQRLAILVRSLYNYTHSFFAQLPSERRTSMLGKSLQSAPGATGMCLILAATRGFISLQMWSQRIGWSCFPRMSRWKCDIGSPLYRISRREAPFLISGKSDIASLTVIVRRGAEERRVILDFTYNKIQKVMQWLGLHDCSVYLIIIDDNCQLNSSWTETVCWFWEIWQLFTRGSSKNNSPGVGWREGRGWEGVWRKEK